jgi:tetraacyldisaccharide 4'-kinase
LHNGERPAILSRGYRRRSPTEGVLVVSDSTHVIEPVERSGDEPQMLARALPGVPVLVAADRYLAGVLAERTFGVTVHLLDDGFQHFPLARDVDLVLLATEDLHDAPLPAGRLRERLEATSAASAIIRNDMPSDREGDAGRDLSTSTFRLVTEVGPAKLVHPFGTPLPPAIHKRALALAAIARAQRFFTTAREQAWDVAAEITFRDHHWYSTKDVGEIVAAARGADAEVIVTTEKDAVRLEPVVASLQVSHVFPTFVFLPINVTVQPEAEFFAWLAGRLAAVRA